jgi:hypothetical protein
MTSNNTTMKDWIQFSLIGLSAVCNSLVPLSSALIGPIGPTYVIGCNLLASGVMLVTMKSGDIAEVLKNLTEDIKEIKEVTSVVGSARPSLPSSRTEDPKEEEEEEPSNEPVEMNNRVPMNAYYYPKSDSYDITPRKNLT